MKRVLSILIVFITLGFSCEKGEPTPDEGQIYLRIVQDLSAPYSNAAWCDMVSGCYNDNNPNVPSSAGFDQFYGPLKPGTYQASYCFDRSRPTENIITFNYVLESPEPGKRRMYTKLLRDFYTGYNRCLDVSKDPSTLTYVDEQM